MRHTVSIAALAFTASSFSSCITVAPVHGMYETAATLGKANLEMSGNFTHYVVYSGGETEAVNNNLGFRVGYGLSDKVDLKFRYENLEVIHPEPGLDFKASYYSVIPKINFRPGRFSLFVPLSMYKFKSTTRFGTQKTASYSIAPHLIKTFALLPNKMEISTSSNLEYIINHEEGESSKEFLGGFNIGAGLSSDLSKWAIRPEIGFLSDLLYDTGGVFNFGVGFQLILFPHKKNK